MRKLGWFWWLPFGRVPEISPNDLHTKLKNNHMPYIFDVRTRREWKANRVEGAEYATITALRDMIKNRRLDPDHPVVAICLTAHRSIPAVRVLQASGFTDVRQLQGGMRAWWKAGLPVVKGS